MREITMIRLEIRVAVPRDGGAVIDLNEANPSFDQSAGNESLPSMHGISIGLSNMGRLTADVEGVDGLQLHTGRELISLDACFNSRVIVTGGLVEAIQCAQE